MKLARTVFASALAAGILTLALVAQSAKPSASLMNEAAQEFLASLTPEQRAKASFPLDSAHRSEWYFTPQQTKQKTSTRLGVRLDGLSEPQQTAALKLLRSGLSKKGFDQIATIRSLESLLSELEGPKGGLTRDPMWYFVSIFGTPSNTGEWGWRFEGHHLSVNVTLNNGEVVSATPMVFGANPAEVKAGARQGLRTLPEIEDVAKELIRSLNETQNSTAKQAKHFAEVQEKQAKADAGAPVGLRAAALDAAQQATLTKLIGAYANRLPADVAAEELKRVKYAGQENVWFAYSGDLTPGKGYTYRIHGPTFVAEFINLQADAAKNPANHIHSAWRRLPADFSGKN